MQCHSFNHTYVLRDRVWVDFSVHLWNQNREIFLAFPEYAMSRLNILHTHVAYGTCAE